VGKKWQVGRNSKNDASTVRKCTRETTARARAVNAQNDRGGRWVIQYHINEDSCECEGPITVAMRVRVHEA